MQFDADLLFKDHGEDAQNEDDQGSGLLPDGDAGEIFGGELVVVRADKILVVRQQLIAEHRKIQNAEDEHRQADADVLKEAGLDAKLIERICADEVAGRADDREVAAERGCENERHEELSAREVGGRCDADDDRDQHGGCAGIGQEPAHQTRDEHDGDDALALRFGKACDKTADLVRHAGLKERLADDEHSDTVLLTKPAKAVLASRTPVMVRPIHTIIAVRARGIFSQTNITTAKARNKRVIVLGLIRFSSQFNMVCRA